MPGPKVDRLECVDVVPLNHADLRAAARGVLPADVFDHVDGGADGELTRIANVDAWSRWWLRPRVLQAVETASLHVEVAGSVAATPILVAPMAQHGLVTAEAERATAAGAAQAGCGFVASTLSTLPLEEVAAASGHPAWLQLYVFENRDEAAGLVQRARAAAYQALVLTVDAPGLGHKRRDEANGFSIRARATYGNVGDAHSVDLKQARNLTMQDVRHLVDEADDLPVLVKGVLRADDARRCVDAGAAGVIVSNHGGRQVDGAMPTALALAEVAEAVGDRATVLVDGGIRDPSDVVRALALGADAVLVGRPVLWAAALGGQAAVASWLTRLVEGTERALRLCGVSSAADVPRDLVCS